MNGYGRVSLLAESYMKVQKVYVLQQSQILGNPTQCLLRHSQAYKKVQRQSHRPRCLALRTSPAYMDIV